MAVSATRSGSGGNPARLSFRTQSAGRDPSGSVVPFRHHPRGYDGRPHDFPGFTISVCALRPTSGGHLKARSKDMSEPPKILMNYFSTEEDRRVMIAGVRLAQDIAQSRSMSAYVAAPYLPDRFLETDEEIGEFIPRDRLVDFHPVGSCHMGHDSMAVVDPQLRVQGVSGLRIVDASVMPVVETPTPARSRSGNTRRTSSS